MSFLILEMNLANTYMCRLLFIKIKSSITASKLLSAVIVISIVASMFCINVMLGYSEELYRESYDASWYSTICVTNMDASECEAINDYITSVKQYKIGSSLAFSQADDVIVIGWNGTDTPERWFPTMSGRFFTDAELSEAVNLAYISKDLHESNQQKTHIIVNGLDYETIGYGWIVGANFTSAIGNSSSQSVVENKNPNLYMIIPHLTYVQNGYTPSMLLIHINEITYDQLNGLIRDLQVEFPSVEFTQSDNNSDAMRASEKLAYVPCGIILALIICISLIQIFTAWFDETKDIVNAYIVCGMSRKKMIAIMLLEILTFVIAGEAFALLIQWLLLPLLSYMGASYMPSMADIIVTTIFAYIMLVLFMYKRIVKNASVKRGVML